MNTVELFERDGELEKLTQIVDRSSEEGGRVALIRGPAGVGKTVLVDRFIDEVGGRALIGRGACDDLSTPQPLGPLWEIRHTMPELLEPLESQNRLAVAEAMLTALSTRIRPVVIVIEDVQWADQATLDLIRYVGRRLERAGGLLILTYRDGEVDTDHPLRSVVGDLPPNVIVRLPLGPLSRPSIEALLAGSGLDADTVADLTGGNPLFLHEVLIWGADGVPPSVADSVRARFHRMSPGARALVALVAIMPGGARRDLVDAILAPSLEDERDGARLLAIDPWGFTFHHELARRAIESTLVAADRVAMSRRVLTEIVGTEEPAVIAHFAREAGDREALVQHAPAAARAALAMSSNREALAHFESLEPHLDLLPAHDRALLLEDWARATSAVHGPDRPRIEQAIALHRATGADEDLARALALSVRIAVDAGAPEEATEHAAEAVAILQGRGPSPTLAFALSQQAVVTMLRGDQAGALAILEPALEMAEHVGDVRSALSCRITRAAIGQSPGDLEQCAAEADRSGHPDMAYRALVNIALNGQLLPSVADELRAWQRVHASAQTADRQQAAEDSLLHLALAHLRAGQWAGAGDLALRHLGRVRQQADLLGSQKAHAILAEIAARRGREDSVEHMLACLTAAAAIGQPQHQIAAGGVAARVAWLLPQPNRELIRAAHEAYELARAGLHWPHSTGEVGWWLWLLGEIDSIPPWCADHYVAAVTGDVAAAAGYWARRGEPYEEAVALMRGTDEDRRRAVEVFDGVGAPVPADRVRQDLRNRGVHVPGRRRSPSPADSAGLTNRQSEVLGFLAEGLTSPQIADRLFISPRTVESHVAAIMLKLDAADRHEAVRRAREAGLVAPSAGAAPPSNSPLR